MRLDEWETSVPDVVRADGTWKVQAYRLGLFLSDRAWADAEYMEGHPLALSSLDQLCRAAGSIAANIAEGYGRRSSADRARYFEYALGSVAETRTWYLSLQRALPEGTLPARLEDLASTTRLLLTMIKNERVKHADWSSTRRLKTKSATET